MIRDAITGVGVVATVVAAFALWGWAGGLLAFGLYSTYIGINGRWENKR